MKRLCIVLIPFLLYSCNSILLKLYGITELKGFDEKKYNDFVNSIDKKNVQINTFFADTVSYGCIRSMAESRKIRNGLSQPIQILYFNYDSLASFHANCYAEGKGTNLNWNTSGRFEKFIPATAIPLDSARFTLGDFAKYYSSQRLVKQNKITVIIYWTLMMEKLSRSAIETVIDNITRFGKTNETSLYLINNDHSFITK